MPVISSSNGGRLWTAEEFPLPTRIKFLILAPKGAVLSEFHLQLYRPKALDWTIVLLALFLPAALAAYLVHSLMWFVGVPFGIIVLMLFIAAWPSKRCVTAEQFADELEKHLLGTEGPWDWDDTTSVRKADPGLEAVRMRLGENLDSLCRDEDKDELRANIADLRRGPTS